MITLFALWISFGYTSLQGKPPANEENDHHRDKPQNWVSASGGSRKTICYI